MIVMSCHKLIIELSQEDRIRRLRKEIEEVKKMSGMHSSLFNNQNDALSVKDGLLTTVGGV